MDFLKKIRNVIDEYAVVILIIMLSFFLIAVPVFIKMKEKQENYIILNDFVIGESGSNDESNIFTLVDYQHPVYLDNWYRHTLYKDKKKAP